MLSKLWIIRNHRKLSLIWSFICLFMCCVMLIGSTYAWFSKTVTSGNNRIVSGDLRIGLTYKSKSFLQNADGSGDWNDWKDAADSEDILNRNALYEPGYVSLTFFKVENLGSLSFKYQLALLKKSETESMNVLGEKFRISDYLTFNFVVLTDSTAITKKDVLQNSTYKFTRENAIALNTPAPPMGFALQHTVDAVMNSKNESDIVALIITMPSDVGTAALYDSAKASAPELTLDFRLVATQYTQESDSFDQYYDETAAYQPEWTSFQYIKGGLSGKGLSCYNDSGEAVVTVSSGSASGDYTMVVSECSLPIGFTAASGTTYRSYNIALLDSEGNTANGGSYRVRMFAGKNLADVKLFHNGELASSENGVEYLSYDPESGYIVFNTTSFSVFTVAGTGAAARVGNVCYPSVEEAFNAVHTGSSKTATITLLSNISEITSTLQIKTGENITLDLNGCALRSSLREFIKNFGTFTIKDSAPNGSGTVTTGGHIDLKQEISDANTVVSLIDSTGNLNLEDIRINSSAVTTNGYVMYRVINSNGNLNISGGEITADVKKSESGNSNNELVDVINSDGGNVTVKNTSLSASTNHGLAVALKLKNTVMYVSGCSFKVKDSVKQSKPAYGISIEGTTNGEIKGSNISVTGENSCNTFGIYKNGTGDVDITDTAVKLSSESGSSTGIVCGGSGTVNISGKQSSIDMSTTSAFSYGIHVTSAGKTTISDENIRLLSVPGRYSIYGILNSSADCSISDCELFVSASNGGQEIFGVNNDSGAKIVDLSGCKISAFSLKPVSLVCNNGTIDKIDNCELKVLQGTNPVGIKNSGSISLVSNCLIDIAGGGASSAGIQNGGSGSVSSLSDTSIKMVINVYGVVGILNKDTASLTLNGGNSIILDCASSKPATPIDDKNGNITNLSGNEFVQPKNGHNEWPAAS